MNAHSPPYTAIPDIAVDFDEIGSFRGDDAMCGTIVERKKTVMNRTVPCSPGLHTAVSSQGSEQVGQVHVLFFRIGEFQQPESPKVENNV